MNAALTSVLLFMNTWSAAQSAADWETQAEIDQHTTDKVRKVAENFKQRLKEHERRRKELGDQGDPREAERADDTDSQPQRSQPPAGSPESYMQDLIEEYEEEKGQAAEEAIWTVAEEKGSPEIRPMYREYLRRVYFGGQGKDANGSAGVAWIKRNLDTKGGWQNFPTAHVGPPPIPGAAGVYETGPQHITVISADAIVVFSHEMWHHIDNVTGGIDGFIAMDGGGVEPLAYGLMGTELGSG
ncbi:MAG: hypothetical protein WC728_00820 [Elusimicrobiota bacterium]